MDATANQKTAIGFLNNPKTAKLRFTLRRPVNLLYCFGIQLAVVASVGIIAHPFAWTAACICGVALFFVYFFIWEKRAIGFNCPECGKYILSNIPWKCGFKKCRNDGADHYPFVHKCQICGAAPKAYLCHHSEVDKEEHLIFFTKDEFKENFARSVRPFKERSDLDIAGLRDDYEKACLESKITGVDRETERLNAGPDPQEADKKRRANDNDAWDHDMLMIKKRAIKAAADAEAKRAEEANLPPRERAKRDYDRKMERFEVADEGRALVRQRWPEGSPNFERGMLIWDQYEQDGSLAM